VLPPSLTNSPCNGVALFAMIRHRIGMLASAQL
jgi:hypothetical protein